MLCVCFSDWGTGAHATPLHSSEWPSGGPHPRVIQSAVHAPGNQPPMAPSTPLGDLCGSPLVDSCSSPALLRLTLMFNPILAVSSFSPQSCSAGHEYPKVCLLDRIIPLFKATGNDSSAAKNTLNESLLSCFVSLSFLYSLSLSHKHKVSCIAEMLHLIIYTHDMRSLHLRVFSHMGICTFYYHHKQCFWMCVCFLLLDDLLIC